LIIKNDKIARFSV